MKKLLEWLKKITSKKVIEVRKIPNRPLTDDEFNERRLEREKKLNRVLEKLNEYGIESLSQNERNFLRNYGRS